jgi:acetyl-CoA carboxylase carboxyl transferase subunit beta
MTWFKRQKAGIQTDLRDQMAVPEGQWVKCPDCSEPVHRRELQEQMLVCPKCSYHFKMSAGDYFGLLFDNSEYERHDDDLIAVDRLGFVDRKRYKDRLRDAQEKTGLNDGALSATGKIGGHEVSVGAMDFSFIGGSMGSVIGEILARAIKRAYDREIPLLIIAQSGGARMMEGALSLMQMAKTSAQLARLAEKSLPYFVLLTNPTTGGVTASFAMLGDIHLAEPGALIGFAGPRVIRETMGQDLPDGFQTAEFLQEHGFVDTIVDRRVNYPT